MKRYPGIRPFRTDEKGLFFGRDADIARLHRLIDLEQLVILYGKSGYGKSSLLSAGIFPRLQNEGRRRFWEIRFGPCKPGDSPAPADNIRQALARTETDPANPVSPVHKNDPANPVDPVLKKESADPVQLLPNAEPGLWLSLKTRQQGGQNSFLLVFDQFEELFSYPPDQILEFKKQLAEALYSKIPKRYETALAGAGLTPEQEDALYAPFDLKVVFSIRSDRMSLLNGLKDYLPNLLQHGYELEALDEEQARQAIVAPAALNPGPIPSPTGDPTPDPSPTGRGDVASSVEYAVEGIADRSTSPLPVGEGSGVGLTPVGSGSGLTPPVFDTPPFTYAPETLSAIFTALHNERGRIETSALQIVCSYVENYVVDPNRQKQVIRPADLGDIKSIFRQFYERTIANLPEAQQETARRLAEDLLIKDGARIPYAAQALLAAPGVTQELLDRLAAASLLRVERDEQGRMLYEVGHDTLVAPISEAAQARRAEEEKLRLQQEADEQRREKEKAMAARRRARLVAAGAVVLSLVAILASYIAYLKSNEANAKAAIILEKEKQVEENVRIAKDKTNEAADALKRAEENEAEARLKNEEVQRLKGASEEDKRGTALALQQAQEERRRAEEATIKVAQSLMNDASSAIHRLDYETARERLHDAADLCSKKPFENPLGRLRPALADSLMEPAYFLNESGNFAGAMFEVGMIAMTLSAHDPADTLQIDARTPEGSRYARNALRTILRTLRPAAFDLLEKKYYPVLLPVPGGTFHLSENYRATLSDYQLARTETTVWQYNLYLAEQGKDIFDNKTISRPGWGWEGDNPIVNVSWFDACLYANWLSRRFGLREAYDMGEVSEGSYGDYYKNISLDTTANGFRLPTEAEWEFAARGGTAGLRDSFEYAGGNDLKRLGWYLGNSGNRTRAVAQFLPNQLGLYDMSGNVWEWCQDWYEGDYPSGLTAPAVNPTGPNKGVRRVLRGGSWISDPDLCRAADRGYGYPYGGYNYIGFRVARH